MKFSCFTVLSLLASDSTGNTIASAEPVPANSSESVINNEPTEERPDAPAPPTEVLVNADVIEPESTEFEGTVAETNSSSETDKEVDIDDEKNMANGLSFGGGARGGSVGGSSGGSRGSSGSSWRGSSGRNSGGYYGGSSRSAAGRTELSFGVAVTGILFAISL
ncbi:hypothetical protein A1Q2_01841 [Trichosporon asahii var. asahii CBS 8904]|uniref:Uncharacterized protein n=1 Tax=Trichosporon asahii var. asahii (strain CBS 8904) TaxID=1220162 RepID=K1W4N0_TRIAC|nr:hypothetical protein A1Q2_01841 [Trichosporon asahii var. asahii CBS 8904]